MGLLDWLRWPNRPDSSKANPSPATADTDPPAPRAAAPKADSSPGSNRENGPSEPSSESKAAASSATNFASPPAEPPPALAEQRLMLQVWHRRGRQWRPAPGPEDDAITRALTENLVMALVATEGETKAHSISASELAGWGLSPAEAWHAAVANVMLERVEPKLVQLPHASAVVLLGNGVFVGAMVGDIARSCAKVGVSPSPEHGVLVAVPNRHALVVAPVKLGLTRESLRELSSLAKKLYDYTDALSPDLYLWRNGTLEPIDPEHPPVAIAL